MFLFLSESAYFILFSLSLSLFYVLFLFSFRSDQSVFSYQAIFVFVRASFFSLIEINARNFISENFSVCFVFYKYYICYLIKSGFFLQVILSYYKIKTFFHEQIHLCNLYIHQVVICLIVVIFPVCLVIKFVRISYIKVKKK